MKNPKISVIMPNYNCEKYIAKAIDSILNQTFTDFEFIIIDDGSTDNSWNIIQEYAKKDERIVAVRNDENKHIVYTRNRWLKIAKWEYIAFLDSDDVAYKERFEKQLDFMDIHKNIWLCWSNFDFIDNTWKITWGKKFPETDKEIKKSIWFRNPFWQNTMMILKKCFDEIWFYDDWFRNAEDLDMWIRMWTKYEMYNLQENLVQYRIYWENSILKQQKLMIQNTLKARRKALKLWYNIWIKWIIFYIWTWFMQFLPPKFVLWLFNKVNK